MSPPSQNLSKRSSEHAVNLSSISSGLSGPRPSDVFGFSIRIGLLLLCLAQIYQASCVNMLRWLVVRSGLSHVGQPFLNCAWRMVPIVKDLVCSSAFYPLYSVTITGPRGNTQLVRRVVEHLQHTILKRMMRLGVLLHKPLLIAWSQSSLLDSR